MAILQISDLKKLRGQVVALDTETTGLRYYQNGLIGVCVYCPALNLQGYIYTCTYEQVPTGKVKRVKEWQGEYEINPATGRKIKKWEYRDEVKTQLQAVPDACQAQQVKEILDWVADDPATCLIFHNAKFDLHFLGLDLYDKPCKLMDTSVMVHLYDSRLRKSLDACERLFLGTNSKRTHVTKAPKRMPWFWPPEVIADYGENDALVTYQLMEVLLPKLRKLKLVDLFRMQMNYLRTLWRIEEAGMLLNTEFCYQAMEAFSHNIKLMEAELYDACGYEFNWRSHAQLSKAIYENLGIEKPKNPFADADGVDRSRMAHKGKYHGPCTSTFLLMEKAQHPLGGLILDLREAHKLRKTVAGYMELTDKCGSVHTSFNATGTRTGRLSSNNPNVQNIASQHRVRETQSVYSGGAIRQHEYNLRQAFMARPGYTFVSVDHKQQEMRMFGILAQEPAMLEALRLRKDIHLMIAIAVWGDCGKETNKLHREWSKTIGFGLLYGMTVGSLQYRLNKTPEEADEITQLYFNTFPRIQPWLDETIANMTNYGKVRYWSGRVWRESDPIRFYKGGNAQIQGGSADFMALAVQRINRMLSFQGWGKVVSIIHDEMLAEVRDDVVDLATPILLKMMECDDIFGLPFAADAKIGKTYGTLEERDFEGYHDINWLQYMPPGFDINQYRLEPWKSGKI